MLLALVLGCLPPSTPGGGPASGTFVLPLPPELWVIDHPSYSATPGIVHLDGSGVEIGRVPIPPAITSPHALSHDGTNLWVSGYGPDDDGAIYAVDPVTGAVGTKVPIFGGTEGVAASGGELWFAGRPPSRVALDGTVTDTRPGGQMQDLAFDGTDLWYLVNGTYDHVTRVEPSGRRTEISAVVSDDSTSYGMTWYDGVLLVTDTAFEHDSFPDGTRLLQHVDPYTGERLGTSELPIGGWITALVVPPPPPLLAH